MILQIILGGIAGIAITAKLYWTQVKKFLGLSIDDAAVDESAANPNAY